MNKIPNVFILLAIALLSACSSSVPIVQNSWQNKPVTVDGKATEWDIPLQYYDNATKLNFTITNDDTALYYCIRITDDQEELRALRMGIQLWIDTTGKNQRQIGIEYPYSEFGSKDKSNNSHPDSLSGKTPQKQMRLSGFAFPVVNGAVPVPNTYGIKVGIAHDAAGVTIYEGSIPFRTFYKPKLTQADNNRVLGITMVINQLMSAIPQKGGKLKGHGGDAGGMGGGGGMGNMGMHAAGLGGVNGGAQYNKGIGDENEEELPSILKVKIKLSTK